MQPEPKIPTGFQASQEYISQLSIDCVIFGYENQTLKVLVPKLAFKGDFWTLPAGFVSQQEDIDAAARRILEERTGFTNIYMEQFRVFGTADRNNKKHFDELLALNPERFREAAADWQYEWFTRRFVTIGYYALVDMGRVTPRLTALDESIEWYSIKELPPMILDHNEIVRQALETVRLFLDQKQIAYHLLPETFTMKEVQQLYEAIYDRPFAANNFPKKILEQNVLERLEKKFTGAANKAPYLYRVRRR